MTREEQLACLEDRPCAVCFFHTDRCNRWTCVFEDEIEEQQPKTGKWIDDGQYAEGHNEHAYRCSECGEHYIGYVGEFKYCPNCGAKMEVEE